MTVVWGVLDAKMSPDNEMVRRARILFHQLDQRKDEIVIPAVAVAELLVPLTQTDRDTLVDLIQKRFHVPYFDLRAATIASDLWLKHRSIPKEDQIKRAVLKMDVLIIASAKAAGAQVIYSHDRGCRKLASHIMDAYDLPEFDENLFVNLGL
ncbi:MAG: PIN domain-containing protein [Phycisphaera sp.]|nr:PIN domain-containing protein [Phycisphaera sp.]